MQKGHLSIFVLFLVSIMPTVSVLFSFSWSESELQSQIFFIFAKLWIILIPIYWIYRIEESRLSLGEINSKAMYQSIVSGICLPTIYRRSNPWIYRSWIGYNITFSGYLYFTPHSIVGLLFWALAKCNFQYWNIYCRSDLVIIVATSSLTFRLLDISCYCRCGDLRNCLCYSVLIPLLYFRWGDYSVWFNNLIPLAMHTRHEPMAH